MKIVVALLALVAAAQAVSFFEIAMDEWEAWKLEHGKNYTSPVEEKLRMKIYMENRAKIAKHNHKAQKGIKGYTLKMNHFGDLLHHEFVKMMNGFDYEQKKQMPRLGSTFIRPAHVELPKEVDWRKHGAVTPVKDQGQCGSCWAFSTTGSLEGQHFRKTGKMVSLSEQNLVDCSASFGNNGCNGGLMDNAFRYVKANGGIDTEKAYPYRAEDESCHFMPGKVGATDTGYTDIKQGDEEDLMAALATVGPVSVAIDASHQSFQFYHHGVYDEPECDPQNLDHGVLAVGYGTDENGVDYYIVKNSWAETWGLNGYIHMSRNKNNQCGIASCASYPLV